MRKLYVILFLVPFLSRAQEFPAVRDSLGNYVLDEVEIQFRNNQQHHSPVPVQILNARALQNMNSLSVADAVRYFSGIQLKDYGGIGGLKTINVRSLGSHHTAVFYDGIAIGNAQNGQVDLGKYSLSNMEEVRLYSGQQPDLLQSARSYASASSIYLRSRKPFFSAGKAFNASVSLKGGSFGLINPVLDADYRISPTVSSRFSIEHTRAHGEYKFRYTNGVYDTTAVRNNADIAAYRLEAAVFGEPDSLSSWTAKYYHYQSERGLPGAIVSNRFEYSQRMWDKNRFLQFEYNRKVAGFYRLAVKAKYATDDSRYLDPEHVNTEGFLDNRYEQREWYLSAANEFQLLPFWKMSVAADHIRSTMEANLYRFAFPTRNTTLIALASEWRWNDLNIQASVLGSFIHELAKEGPPAADRSEYTPSLMANWKPFAESDLRVRAFYKSIFRMPTFNDLYYTFIGSRFLRPEYTQQYNLGGSYSSHFENGFWKELSFHGDVYHNLVRDKIVAMPSMNLAGWTIINLDKVSIQGLDLRIEAKAELDERMQLSALLNYTWQQARDMTPGAYNYKHQIPYVPLHAVSFTSQTGTEFWGLNYSFIYTGERYSQKTNIPVNYVEPWYTHDLSAWYILRFEGYPLRLGLEVNNVLNQYYDVVLNFPMPGRNYRFTLNLKI